MIQRAFRAKRARAGARKTGTYARAGFPKARIGKQMGTFGKKGSMPKPIVGVKQHIDTHYVRTGDNVCYFGASVSSTRDEILSLFAMTLVQEVAKRSGLIVSAWTALMPNYLQGGSHVEDGRLKGITIRFRRELENAIDEFSNVQVNSSTGTTYYSFAQDIAAQIKTRAEDGFYPFEYQLIEVQGAGEQSYYVHNRFDQDMVHFYVTMNAKIQNVTPAYMGEYAGMNMNDINANPLSGVLYDFKHETPRLAAGYEDGASAGAGSPFSAISKIGQQADDIETVYVEALRTNESPTGSLENAFQQPPSGAAVFQNLDGSKRVAMPPGGFFTLKRNYLVKASVQRFIAACIKPNPGVVLAQMSLPILRKSFMVGLEPTVRTTNSETVKININKETVQVMKFTRAKSPNAPAHVKVTQF